MRACRSGSSAGQRARRPVAQSRFHALLREHAVAGARPDPREPEPYGGRAEIYNGHQLRHTTSGALASAGSSPEPMARC
jgi:hypothetical protein